VFLRNPLNQYPQGRGILESRKREHLLRELTCTCNRWGTHISTHDLGRMARTRQGGLSRLDMPPHTSPHGPSNNSDGSPTLFENSRRNLLPPPQGCGSEGEINVAWVSDLQHAQAVSHMLLPDFHTRTHTGSGMGALEGGTRGSMQDERGVAD